MSDGFGAFPADPFGTGGDPFGADLFADALFVDADAASGPGGDGLWVSVGEGWFDVGAAGGDGVVDADGDGRCDTATVTSVDGLAVFSDLDADGVADVYHHVHTDGRFETWTYDAAEGWSLLDRGDL
ncbi:DUF6802 family protein [Tsukamurella soli]|uniref:DUF6802 family protein n=1 Tax=Tsukamurella soli TaxID=644556 RepID=UPI0031E9A928